MTEEPHLTVKYRVSAYDESGYGEDASRGFTSGQEAVKYAKSHESRFGARVFKDITMQPISIKIWPND